MLVKLSDILVKEAVPNMLIEQWWSLICNHITLSIQTWAPLDLLTFAVDINHCNISTSIIVYVGAA